MGADLPGQAAKTGHGTENRRPDHVAVKSPYNWHAQEAPRVRFRIDVYPEESLQSILARSAREHVLWQTAPILTAAGLKGFRPGRLQHLAPEQLERLAYVLRQAPEVLISRSIIIPSGRPAPGQMKLPKGLIDLQSRWIAPRSLERSPYLRFAWNVRLLPYCPDSGERLVNSCSHCGHKLGWFQARGLHNCESCLEIIVPSSEPNLAQAALPGYRRIARMLAINAETRQTALRECDEELHEYEPAKVAITAIALARILMGKGEDKRELRTFFSLPPRDMGMIVAAAGDLLVDWQSGANCLLRTAAKDLSGDPALFGNLWLALKAMADPSKSDLVTSEIVILALPSLVGNVWAAMKGQRRTYHSQQVLRVLGVPNKTVRRLADAQAIKVEMSPSRLRRKILFDADEVDDLRQAIENTISLSAIASDLKMPCYAVEQLAAMGLLEHVPSLALQIIYGQTRLRRASVADLIGQIARVIPHTQASGDEAPKGLIPLRSAMRIFGGREKPWGAVIQAIRDGALPCWATSPKLDSRSLLVRQTDLNSMQHMRFCRDQFHFPFSQVISQQDAEDLLNINARIFLDHNLAEALGFRKSGKGCYAPFEGVSKLAQAVVPRSELGLRWGVTPNTVSADPRLTGIELVSFGWDRAQLIAALV